MDVELIYLLLVCALLVVPRWLQRFRIPAPLTCFVFGMALVALAPGHHSGAIQFAAVLGVSSLFLYAGLEVDLDQLLARRRPILIFLAIRLCVIAAGAAAAVFALSLPWQPALLLALAVFTPSTGFIVDSLDRFAMEAEERFWVTNLAIAGELVALALMFVALRSDSLMAFGAGALTLLALLVLVPLAYLVLSRWVLPHAPGSEFSLLIMVAIVAAVVTDRLGVEFLLGAFIAGVAARQLQPRVPALASHHVMHGVKLFSSFFLPFYFFRNGGHVPLAAFDWTALLIGLGLSLLLPLRIFGVFLQRRSLGVSRDSAMRIAVSLTPTLIFTLVLAQLLHERFHIPSELYAGLLIYAAINTLLPSLLLKSGFDMAQAEPPRDGHTSSS